MDEILDWHGGRAIDLRGRKKILWAAGVLSKSGDAARQLAGFGRHLQRHYGYVGGDFLEATYRGRLVNGAWSPAPYREADAEAPLDESSTLVVRQLRWYDVRLPDDIELHLIGYSLGGVVLFRAASRLLAEHPGHWRRRLRSLITLASPHFGCDLGPEGDLLGLFGLGALLPGGTVGQELCALGRDPLHRARVQQEAELLQRSGVRLLTLADEYDTVVTPTDAVIAPPDERERLVLRSSRALQGGVYSDALLGHGPLLENPKAWTLMGETVGPQEPR